MSRLGAIGGAVAATMIATQCKKAETFGNNNTNSFNGNTGRFNDGDNPDSFSNNTNCFNNNGDVHQYTWNYSGGDVNQRGFINVADGGITIFGITIINGKPVHHTVGSGNRTQKTVQILGSPTKVDVSIGNLTIKQGDEQSLVVHADDNIHQHLKQVITAASIQLRAQDNSSFSTKNPIEYTLTLQNAPNDLRASGCSRITTESIKTQQMRLILSGQSKIYIPTLQTKKLTADVSGQSTLHIPKLKTEALTVDLSGQSKIMAAGSTNKQSVECSGQSSYKAADLESLSTHIDVSGQSCGEVHAKERVTGDISGMSKLAIHGNPNDVDVDASGMSRWFFV
jgi:hypothetical protein